MVDFRVRVENENGYALWVKGSHNRELKKTSFTLFSQDTGRLFSVDVGIDHHNRDCKYVAIFTHTDGVRPQKIAMLLA